MPKIIYIFFFLFLFAWLKAQEISNQLNPLFKTSSKPFTSKSVIHGTVKNNQGEGIPKAKIFFVDLNQNIYSDKNGFFRSPALTNGDWGLVVSAAEYQEIYQEINITNTANVNLDIILNKNTSGKALELNEIFVKNISADHLRNNYLGNINLLDNDRLKELQLKDIKKIETIIPNFETVYWNGPNTGKFATRGIVPLRDEPVIGFYIDGTPLLFDYRPSLLKDISSIKVLKGPQLKYGVSPVGGIIDITSAAPSDKYLIYLSAGFANFGGMEYSLETSLPIIKNKLHLNLSGYWEKLDGYFTNINLNRKLAGGFDGGGFNGQLNYRLKGHTIAFSTYYKGSRENHLPFSSSLERAERFPYWIEHNVDNLKIEDVLGFSLSHRYHFPGAKLHSSLNFKHLNRNEIIDTDFGNRDIIGNDFDLILTNDTRSYFVGSEINIKSENENPLTWESGLYFNTGERQHTNRLQYVYFTPTSTTTPNVSPNPRSGDSDLITANRKRGHFSFWGNIGYNLKSFSFNLDGRMDYHQRTIEIVRTEKRQRSNFFTNFNSSLDFFFLSPKATIAFQRSFVNIFGNISYTSKPGGYNFLVSRKEDLIYLPERILHSEIGVKIFPIKNIYASLIGFLINWEDTHIYTFKRANAYEFSTDNGGKVRSLGIELEMLFRIKGFLLEANLGYTQADFLDGSSEDAFRTLFNSGETSISFAGNKVPFTPDFNSFVALQYKRRFQFKKVNLTPYIRFEYSYKSGQYFSEYNENKSKPSNLLNAKIGLNINDYELVFYVNNILNQQNYVYIVEFTDFSGNVLREEPLRYGITLSKKFRI